MSTPVSGRQYNQRLAPRELCLWSETEGCELCSWTMTEDCELCSWTMTEGRQLCSWTETEECTHHNLSCMPLERYHIGNNHCPRKMGTPVSGRQYNQRPA